MEKQQETSTNIRLCMRETIMCDHLFLGSNAFTRFEHNLRLALLFQAVKKVNLTLPCSHICPLNLLPTAGSPSR